MQQNRFYFIFSLGMVLITASTANAAMLQKQSVQTPASFSDLAKAFFRAGGAFARNLETGVYTVIQHGQTTEVSEDEIVEHLSVAYYQKHLVRDDHGIANDLPTLIKDFKDIGGLCTKNPQNNSYTIIYKNETTSITDDEIIEFLEVKLLEFKRGQKIALKKPKLSASDLQSGHTHDEKEPEVFVLDN